MELNRDLTLATDAVSPYSPSLSLFAKLLASEQIVVTVNSALSTAAFNPVTRTLSLPTWSGWSEAAWLFLIAHEVGHAIWTPVAFEQNAEWRRLSHLYGTAVVMNTANIVEDIRVERMIREKYRGLAGVFNRGYVALIAKDFFNWGTEGLTPKKWLSYGPLNRINVYAKVGGIVRVSLITPQEIGWFNRALKIETFDEVMVLVGEMLETLKKQQDEKKAKDKQKSEDKQKSAEKNEQKSDDQSEKSNDKSNDKSDESDDCDDSSDDSDDDSDDDAEDEKHTSRARVDTDDAEDEDPLTDAGNNGAAKDEQDGTAEGSSAPTSDEGDGNDGKGTVASDGVAEGTEAADLLSTESADASRQKLRASVSCMEQMLMFPANTDYLHYNDAPLAEVLESWQATAEDRTLVQDLMMSYRREASATLASMIAAFRANQSAWCQRRAIVSRSGMLDPVRLANYKLTEDLFLRRREVPEAQNHGFVLHVDFSGSMTHQMTSVLWQTLHLIWFAESIKVPVQVFGFNTCQGMGSSKAKGYDAAAARTGTTPITERLIELYDSSAPLNVKQTAMAHLFAIILKFGKVDSARHYAKTNPNVSDHELSQTDCILPTQLNRAIRATGTWSDGTWSRVILNKFFVLGSTPLFHALLSSVDTVRKFRQKNRVEQCVSVWLTDGEDTQHIPLNAPIQPSTTSYGHRTNVTPNENGSIMDVRSGKLFKQNGDRTLAMMFEYHRVMTGALVVCIDITNGPIASFRRVASSASVNVIGGMVGESADMSKLVAPTSYNSRYSRRSDLRRFRRDKAARVKVKVVKQTRKAVVIPTASGTFDNTGLMSVTREQFPEIGADVYLVSHPDWWVSAETELQKKRAKSVMDRMAEYDDDDDDYDAGFTKYAPAPRVTLNAALVEQQKSMAMRRFADMLVPYMAHGNV